MEVDVFTEWIFDTFRHLVTNEFITVQTFSLLSGSLDYPSDERKKLAKKSISFVCPDCGPIIDLLKCKGDTAEVTSSTAEEAKEIIKTMSLKVKYDWIILSIISSYVHSLEPFI